MEEIQCCIKNCHNRVKCPSRASWRPVQSKKIQEKDFNIAISVRKKIRELKLNSMVCPTHFETKLCYIKDEHPELSLNAKTARVVGKPKRSYNAAWKIKKKFVSDVSRNILEEHNYFICKENVLKLQEAVAEAGRLYEELQEQVHNYRRVVVEKDKRTLELRSANLARSELEDQIIFGDLLVTWNDLCQDPATLRWYTGFDSLEKFHRLVDFLRPAYPNILEIYYRRRQFQGIHLPMKTQLFIVLSRFRLGCFDKELLKAFGLPFSFHSLLWEFWLILLYKLFKNIPLWPQKTPDEPISIMLDSTKVFTKDITACEFSNPDREGSKALIGVSPDGCIQFASGLFAKENISDCEITEKSGILSLLKSGDRIFADGAFSIGKLLEGKNITLINTSRTESFGECNRRVVESVISKIKNYEIVEIRNRRDTRIWTICCYLVNFNNDAFDAKNRN